MNQPPERPHPGDMVLITANFLDDRSNYGIVIRQYSPQVNPGYEVLIGGKKKYFPPHLIKIELEQTMFKFIKSATFEIERNTNDIS